MLNDYLIDEMSRIRVSFMFRMVELEAHTLNACAVFTQNKYKNITV